MDELQRLQKIMARWGVASRRQAEVMIRAGRVSVNGAVVTEVGTKANASTDRITVDGRPLSEFASPGEVSLEGNGSRDRHSSRVQKSSEPQRSKRKPRTSSAPPQLLYLLLNKPRGVISTCTDPHGRKTVLDILPSHWKGQARLFPVGRLDADSTGALLLTNDGDLTLKLTHPRYHLSKTYRVVVRGKPPEAALQQWRDGVELDDGMTLPAEVQFMSPGRRQHPASKTRSAGERTVLKIVLKEGRNRQIRRVAQLLGYPVIALHREAIGPVTLADLKSGQCRALRQSEVRRLKAYSQGAS